MYLRSNLYMSCLNLNLKSNLYTSCLTLNYVDQASW